ncbi:MAG: DUF6473 family protein [Dinoroseobacter sp.]|nr:DUF6473 family protein [Dinoroseobacter sp.]
MSFQHHGADAISYAPCFYENIGGPFRGPKRDLKGAYIACLGGAGMFGKFVPQALPDALETGAGLPAVNLGQVNGGIDFMSDPDVLAIAQHAECTVVELVGAHNLSNRFYRVHARRNDRVISGTPLLQEVFPTLDLSDVHFTRHLLTLMQHIGPRRMETVIEELQQTWLEKMQGFLSRVPGPVILLWMGGERVPERAADPSSRLPFVDLHMVVEVAQSAADLIVVDAQELGGSRAEMDLPAKYKRQLRFLPSAQEIAVAANQVLHRIARQGFVTTPTREMRAG